MGVHSLRFIRVYIGVYSGCVCFGRSWRIARWVKSHAKTTLITHNQHTHVPFECSAFWAFFARLLSPPSIRLRALRNVSVAWLAVLKDILPLRPWRWKVESLLLVWFSRVVTSLGLSSSWSDLGFLQPKHQQQISRLHRFTIICLLCFSHRNSYFDSKHNYYEFSKHCKYKVHGHIK